MSTHDEPTYDPQSLIETYASIPLRDTYGFSGPKLVEIPIGVIEAGLAPATQVQTRTCEIGSPPIWETKKRLLATMKSTFLTLVKAPFTNGGYEYYATLRFNWEFNTGQVGGVNMNSKTAFAGGDPIHFKAILLEEQGGALGELNFSTDIPCNGLNAFLRVSDINPDYFEKVVKAIFEVGTAKFYAAC